jgi:hypothetical protein
MDAIPTETDRNLGERALIATLTDSFARVTAALTIEAEELRPRENGGTRHPRHHAAAAQP